MLIFICFITRQCGAHLILHRMTKVCAFMHIIDKILEENHNYMSISQHLVSIEILINI